MVVSSFFVVKVKGGVRWRAVKATRRPSRGLQLAVFLLIGRQPGGGALGFKRS